MELESVVGCGGVARVETPIVDANVVLREAGSSVIQIKRMQQVNKKMQQVNKKVQMRKGWVFSLVIL